MTAAICFSCGSLKSSAFMVCAECGRSPDNRESLVRSLIFTDHFFTKEELLEIGQQVSRGIDPKFAPELEAEVAAQVDDDMIAKVKEVSNPKYGSFSRTCELLIVVSMIASLVTFICWMIFRVASR